MVKMAMRAGQVRFEAEKKMAKKRKDRSGQKEEGMRERGSAKGRKSERGSVLQLHVERTERKRSE